MKIFVPTALVTLLCLAPTAWSQPDPNNGATAQNPTNRAVQNFQQRMGQRQRQQLTQFGVTDPAQQDAVIAFLSGEAQGRTKLMEPARTLAQALRQDVLTNAQISGLLNQYQAALEDEHGRHAKAVEQLKAKVNLATAPRLEAYLTLSGAMGDGPSLMDGIGGGTIGGRPGGMIGMGPQPRTGIGGAALPEGFGVRGNFQGGRNGNGANPGPVNPPGIREDNPPPAGPNF